MNTKNGKLRVKLCILFVFIYLVDAYQISQKGIISIIIQYQGSKLGGAGSSGLP